MPNISEFIFLVSDAYAQVEQGVANQGLPQPGFAEVFSKMMPMFAIVFLIFYFMVIKPQQAKLKAQENLLKAIKKGDQVVTTGGIVARVASIEEDCVLLEISNNVKLKVEKQNIVKIKEVKSEAANSAA